MNKIKLVTLIIFGLCLQQLQAAQESKQETENIVSNAVCDFPYLTQGFDFLHDQGLVDQSFHDFIEHNLSDDEDMNFDQVIIDAEDLLTLHMKELFITKLTTAIIEKKTLDQFEDPLFIYVMQHKDSTMQDMVHLWLHEWSMAIDDDDDKARTPLYWAAEYNNKEVLQMLIDVGADVNIQSRGGCAPLHRAAQFGNKEAVQMLIIAGADVNVQSDYKSTPLHEALQNHHEEIAQMLIIAGAHVSNQASYGITALHEAAQSYSKNMTQFLLTKGADVNIQDKGGCTPLFWAIQPGNKEVFQMLIIAGADRNIQNNDGQTPLHVAVVRKNIELVQVLIDNDADFNILDNNDQTAEQVTDTHEIRALFVQDRQQKQEVRVMAIFKNQIKKDWR